MTYFPKAQPKVALPIPVVAHLQNATTNEDNSKQDSDDMNNENDVTNDDLGTGENSEDEAGPLVTPLTPAATGTGTISQKKSGVKSLLDAWFDPKSKTYHPFLYLLDGGFLCCRCCKSYSFMSSRDALSTK